MMIKPCPLCGNTNIVISLLGDRASIQCWPPDPIVFKYDTNDFNRFMRDTDKFCCFVKIEIDKYLFASNEDVKDYLITMWSKRDGKSN